MSLINQDTACPINGITELLNRKWVFGIMKDMFSGKTHFSEFKEGKPEMSNVVLSDTLKYLEHQGLIVKKVHSETNTEYFLTQKGYKINKVLYEMVLYGLYVLEDDLRSDEYKKEIQKDYEDIMEV